MNRLIHLLLPLLFLTSFLSCSENEEMGKQEASVRFCVGDGAVPARGAFTEEKPLVIYVYKRNDPSVQDFSASPYKTVTGKTGTTPNSNGLSDIILTGGDQAGGQLYLENGHTYDFVLLVNPPDEASLTSGGLSDIPNGVDLLAGRADGVAVAADATDVAVSFQHGGADNGNLPHLCSRIDIQATATSDLITSLSSHGGVRLGIRSAEFKRILPKAGLGFSDLEMRVIGSGWRTSSYMIECNTPPVEINTVGDFTTSPYSGDIVSFENGILLPLPLLPNTTKNTMDIDFYVNVNGADVLMAATGVQVAEFKPSYKYTFTLTMKGNQNAGNIDLHLSIEPWLTASWSNGMGGDSAEDRITVRIGSWSYTSWNNVMGGDDASDRVKLFIQDFTNVPWSIDMGGTNDDGTNN